MRIGLARRVAGIIGQTGRRPVATPPPPPEIRFTGRPFVCGAIGRWDPQALERLRQAAPSGLSEVHTSRSVTLWASGPVASWRAGQRQGRYWSPLAAGATPDTWRSAAERRLAAGLAIEPDGTAILHTCGLGLQELYLRQFDGGWYFAGRIDPLLALDAGPLHPDLTAWAGILAVGSPIGDATPFTEVRRATAGTAWRADPARAGRIDRLSFEPAWLAVEPTAPPTAGELVELIAGQLPAAGEPLSIPLSGGWDSRLLAVLACRSGAAGRTAWTTSTDDGWEHDLRLAGPVADALGLDHRLVVAGPEAWLAEREPAAFRLQWQTWLHTWLLPLSRLLHDAGRPVLDGLAGDLLLWGSSLAGAATGEQDPERRRLALLAGLSGNRLTAVRTLAPATAGWMHDAVRAAFLAATGHLAGHPEAVTLGQLVTRTTRAIGLSPTWLFGPEVPVQLPFLHPDVLTAALRVPAGRKADGAFYRELLEQACGRPVASLPSTRDRLPPVLPALRRQTSTAALAALRDAVGTDPEVRALLSPSLAAAVADPGDRQWAQRPALLATAQWAELLVRWRRRYADRLVWPAGGSPG